jgi:hypothetical protein
MNTAQFRIDRRADRSRTNRRRPQAASGTRRVWLELAEAGILYFGITLLPLLLVVLLYQLGVIA